MRRSLPFEDLAAPQSCYDLAFDGVGIRIRLLPWTSEGGRPCLLSTTPGAGGYLARVADRIEAEQMGLAAELLGEAKSVLTARSWTSGELHLLAVRLTEALTYVHRIAESRGARLPATAADDVEEDEDRADDIGEDEDQEEDDDWEGADGGRDPDGDEPDADTATSGQL